MISYTGPTDITFIWQHSLQKVYWVIYRTQEESAEEEEKKEEKEVEELGKK